MDAADAFTSGRQGAGVALPSPAVAADAGKRLWMGASYDTAIARKEMLKKTDAEGREGGREEKAGGCGLTM